MGCSSFWDRALGAISKLKNPFIKSTLEELYKQAEALKLEEKAITQRIEFLTQNNESVKRLRTLPGVGLLTAAAMIAVVDDISRFDDSNKFASYLGLVPRVMSSANTRMMGSITKSGNEILRRYLIHGARAWLKKRTSNCGDPVRQWALEVEARRGTIKAVVALARKMSCISYAMLRDGRDYKTFVFEARLDKSAG